MKPGRWFYNVMGVGMLASALLLAGCGSKDEGGSSTKKIPPPPTARPSITGMAVRFDVSGGSATSGNTNGQSGGMCTIAPIGGRVVTGAAPAPGINNNFLTASVLADNTVTYAELQAISAGNFFLDTTNDTAYFNLFGFDFYLPASATLNLGDAVAGTVDSVVIRTHGPDDVIRIDGTVLTARAAAASVSLDLFTGLASGVAISVNGTISANGSSTQGAGTVQLTSQLGSISIGGTITAVGGSSASPGAGGSIAVITTSRDIYLAAGLIQANGGAGSGTGNGGGGGTGGLTGNFDGSLGVRFGVRANGGASTSGNGGVGGTAQFFAGDVLDLFMPVELNGGNSTNGNGGAAGQVKINASLVRGVIPGTLNGGNGANTGSVSGGDGGTVVISASTSLQSFALDADLTGGSGTSGGDGGGVGIPDFSSPISLEMVGLVEQVLIDISAMGGTGVNQGGSGGQVAFAANDAVRNLTVLANLSGGNGTSATSSGGTGGSVQAGCYYFGNDVHDVLFDVTLDGGDALTGTDGGDAGGITLYSGVSGIGSFPATVRGTANGGDAVTNGGNGGGVAALGQIGEAGLFLAFMANGGAASNGQGGLGGGLGISTNNASVMVSGSFTALGGASNGAGNNGGVGGSFNANANGLGVFTITNLNLNLTGGSSSGANGGNGGVIALALDIPLVITGGTFTTNGGNSTAATGFGGDAGNQVWSTDNVDMRIGGTFRANGGNGPAGGGDGGIMEWTPDENDDGSGAYIIFTGTAEAMGGNATVNGNGGDGGDLSIDNFNIAGGLFAYAAVSEFRGTWNASGGNGAGSGTGGLGGYCDVGANGDEVIVNGTIRANGGSGVLGGGGGAVHVYAFDGGGNGNTKVSVNGLIEANGGTGTTAGGDAGTIAVYGIDAKATVGATLNANGGSATAGGDGGVIYLGHYNNLDQCQSITITSTARIRANGGATNGSGGTIEIDPQGTGGTMNPNIVEQSGRVLEANAHGTGTAGTITRD